VTDQPTDDDQGPITPEVVRPKRGAAGRKRKATLGEPIPAASVDADADADGDPATGTDGGTPPGTRRSTGTMFRAGCLLLVALGVLQLLTVGVPYTFSTDSVRCTGARGAIDAANDDDDDFNDVDLPEGVEDADDVPCDEAIELAGNIPEDEDDEPSGEFISEQFIRTQGIIILIVSVVAAATGVVLLRTRDRRVRIVAFVCCALGILFPLLGFAALLGYGFVVFAIGFSNDARTIFGQGTGFLRPRPRRPAA
jgi:hypothetical protein